MLVTPACRGDGGSPASPLVPTWPTVIASPWASAARPHGPPASPLLPPEPEWSLQNAESVLPRPLKKCSGDVSQPLWCNHKSRPPPTLVREPLRLRPRLHSFPLPVGGHGAMPAVRGPCVWNSHGSWLLTIPCVCRITLGAFTTRSAVIAITPPAAFPIWIHKDAEASGTLRNRPGSLIAVEWRPWHRSLAPRSTHSIRPRQGL